tara:strand:- start:302 stop:748 length:447 start_codon:yes stop_codon:yes gene_type:complete
MILTKVWRIWKYALGSFSDHTTTEYDNAVCAVRSTIFITYLVTNCFITAGVIRHWNPMSKIDTQGMGAPMTPEQYAEWKAKGGKDSQEYKPAIVTPRRIHTPEIAKELKILINEVLDEREGKSGISYFDTQHFKHTVIEEEPPYQPYQ